MPVEKRIKLIDKNDQNLSITKQAELLGIPRSTIYYNPLEDSSDKVLMDQIDEIYTETPFYGQRRIKVILNKKGYYIGRDKIRTLMNKMGITTKYPKPKLSISNKQHKKYPYLLKDEKIERPNQVWGTDITYIKMQDGWMYLIAMLDWFSRFVVAWKLSNSMDETFCCQNLRESLLVGKPEIHNSDQGSQFTSNNYLGILEGNHIQISMDAKGRCYDNIFTERLWRSVKYEEVYLKNYENADEAFKGLGKYFDLYNYRRPHQSLDYKTPSEIYFKK